MTTMHDYDRRASDFSDAQEKATQADRKLREAWDLLESFRDYLKSNEGTRHAPIYQTALKARDALGETLKWTAHLRRR